jgi:hypothetical protein
MAAVWPRRLALVVAPASGESFASWVDRMALRNGCPPWAMVEALGLDVRASSDVRSLAYGVVTTPETRRAIEAATGVSSVPVIYVSASTGATAGMLSQVIGKFQPGATQPGCAPAP